MTIQADILTHLKNREQIVAEFGDRLYWNAAPTKGISGDTPARPYAVLHRTSHDRHHALDGPSGTGFVAVQIDVWGDTSLQAASAAEVIREAIDGYVGPMGDTTATNVQLVNQFDDYEDPESGTRIIDYRTISTYRIGHTETAPSL